MAKTKKVWTSTEEKSAKIKVEFSFRSGKVTTICRPLILRPMRMELKDYNKLIGLIDKYGKTI